MVGKRDSCRKGAGQSPFKDAIVGEAALSPRKNAPAREDRACQKVEIVEKEPKCGNGLYKL